MEHVYVVQARLADGNYDAEDLKLFRTEAAARAYAESAFPGQDARVVQRPVQGVPAGSYDGMLVARFLASNMSERERQRLLNLAAAGQMS